MARADLILSIVDAARQHDDSNLHRSVEALIAEEREKQHHVLADRLEATLRRNGGSTVAPVDAEAPGVELTVPTRPLASLFLPAEVVNGCQEVIEEQHRADLLRAHGLEPRHRLLLVGPPGNGKTSLGEALAEALYLPLVRLRYEAIVGSYLGETSTRLAKAFEIARTRRCVLFLDEFDAIAKERGDEHETGEIKRVVSSLLMLVDALPSHVVVVAASNHPELLDRAVHRRFELHLTLPPPDRKQRFAWASTFLASLGGRPGVEPRMLVEETEGANFSQLHDLALDIRRRQVLSHEHRLSNLIEQRLTRWKQTLA